MLAFVRPVALTLLATAIACGSVDPTIEAKGSGARPKADGGDGARTGAGGKSGSGGAPAGGSGGDGGNRAAGGSDPGGATGTGGQGEGGEPSGSGGSELLGSGGQHVDAGPPGGAGGEGAGGAETKGGAWAICESDDDCADGRKCTTDASQTAGRPAACVHSCFLGTGSCDAPLPGGTVSCVFGSCAITCGVGVPCPDGLECLTGICYY